MSNAVCRILALSKYSLLLMICGSPMAGCMVDLNPDNLNARGFDTSFLPGVSSPDEPIGSIKIVNSEDEVNVDRDAVYDLTVPAEFLDKYDFRIDGGSINANFIDIGGGARRFGGNLPESSVACIDVFLKVAPTVDVCDMFEIRFFNPGLPAGSEQLGVPIKIVTPAMKITVADDELFDKVGVVPNQLGGPTFEQEAYAGLMGLPVGVEVDGSSTAQGSQIPEPTTEIFAAGYAWTTLTLTKAFPDFPCGAGTLAYTVCPAPGADLAEPNGVGYTFFTMLLNADVPLSDPTNSYIFSFVFDSDGLAANNWVASPSFPNDFFQGTDLWYEVSYDPTNGWELICSQVTDGAGQIVMRGIATAANAMIVDNVITLVVPDSEFGGGNALVRYTAFRHSGDFGLNPPFDYSADTEPKIDEGLYPVQ